MNEVINMQQYSRQLQFLDNLKRQIQLFRMGNSNSEGATLQFGLWTSSEFMATAYGQVEEMARRAFTQLWVVIGPGDNNLHPQHNTYRLTQ